MKNILVKIPGTGPDIVIFGTHYDTVRLPNFVGADDGGSGVGTMLELGEFFGRGVINRNATRRVPHMSAILFQQRQGTSLDLARRISIV